ncbi:MAG: SUMF1/EgtB/PvdO family nonheme iron enzyme [Deltaproteobacteria bacterium]|nr:SUMF1/EgtB/PvdO family nonheme iron enzyme [Deltaproteobacteria bacterium]
MVPASPSLWDQVPERPPTPARAPVARGPRAVRPAPPARPPKRSARAGWIVGGAVLVATGIGLGVGLSGSSTPTAAPVVAETRATPERVAPGPDAVAGDAGAGAGTTSSVAPTRPPPTRTTPPAPPPRPEWADALERSNPWVDVAAGSSADVLGVSTALASGPLAGRLTGFRPEDAVRAPARAYRLQQHEITWGELELVAPYMPGLALLERPSWVPKDPARRSELPATGVPWSLAREVCKALGGDLPTEAEWEWAARGADKRPFPWGDEAIDERDVRIRLRTPVPVAEVMSSKLDRTPGEAPIHDLLGNALEWTADLWRDADSGTHRRAVRGWPLARRGQSVPAEGATYRQGVCVTRDCDPTANEAYTTSALVGFRCAAPAR